MSEDQRSTTSSPPMVRAWTPADRPRVLALNRELHIYEKEIRPERAGPQVSDAYFADIERQIEEAGEDAALLVAERGGEVVGFVTCFRDEDLLEGDPEHVYVCDYVVAGPNRRTGVGRALLEGVRGFAAERGIGRISLNVLAGNADALDAYRAMGFRVAGYQLELEAPVGDGANPAVEA